MVNPEFKGLSIEREIGQRVIVGDFLLITVLRKGPRTKFHFAAPKDVKIWLEEYAVRKYDPSRFESIVARARAYEGPGKEMVAEVLSLFSDGKSGNKAA